jgi:hypothetical protein
MLDSLDIDFKKNEPVGELSAILKRRKPKTATVALYKAL